MLSGEHGIGVEKRDLMGAMFTEDDLKQQQRVKCAFDPGHLFEPGQGLFLNLASLCRARQNAHPSWQNCRSPTFQGFRGRGPFTMSDTLKPENAEQLLQGCAMGGRRKAGRLRSWPEAPSALMGVRCRPPPTLDLSALYGIKIYEPAELYMTALAGTPMSDIDAALAEAGQQLSFEPPDLGPLLGGARECRYHRWRCCLQFGRAAAHQRRCGP